MKTERNTVDIQQTAMKYDDFVSVRLQVSELLAVSFLYTSTFYLFH